MGLSRREFCLATGLRLDALYQIEAGLVASPQTRVLSFLQSKGYDRSELVDEWRRYRDWLREQVMAKTVAR